MSVKQALDSAYKIIINQKFSSQPPQKADSKNYNEQ